MATKPTTNDVETLQAAVDRLRPALQILDAFNHRNKNQHRSSRWWAQFDMLRRGTRKLVVELAAVLPDPGQRAAAAAGAGEKRQKKMAGRSVAAGEAARARALWLHEHASPRIFIAFTQLAADNQYAPLGLVLLGVLAQIEAGISPMLPAEDITAAVQPPNEPELSMHDTPSVVPDTDISNAESRDFGVAISREEVLGSGQGSVLAEKEQETLWISKSKRCRDEVSHDKKEKVKPKKDKKKKKKRNGDEFDDLFSSLL